MWRGHLGGAMLCIDGPTAFSVYVTLYGHIGEAVVLDWYEDTIIVFPGGGIFFSTMSDAGLRFVRPAAGWSGHMEKFLS